MRSRYPSLTPLRGFRPRVLLLSFLLSAVAFGSRAQGVGIGATTAEGNAARATAATESFEARLRALAAGSGQARK